MYRSLKKDQIYTGEITEKKSRFLSYMTFAGSEEEALIFIDSIRKKHHDARHNCSAYIIAGPTGDILHSSDDGEPSGTAGKPMMAVLSGAELKNAVMVVTRYFGGVLLGTGGLVRAYTDAAKEALKAAEPEILNMDEFTVFAIAFDYAKEGSVRRLLEKYGTFPSETDYSDKVEFTVNILSERGESFEKELTETLSGAVKTEIRGKVMLPKE
ncbi:MAG: YigZ family protein [Lachnospiraceae bacterium]|nr:YigZ family protein [Lachnospiraceae bacterium]